MKISSHRWHLLGSTGGRHAAVEERVPDIAGNDQFPVLDTEIISDHPSDDALFLKPGGEARIFHEGLVSMYSTGRLGYRR